MEMIVLKGDLTSINADIIVNAANKTLLGGGGVDGMIHRKAGKELLEECKTLGGCNTGEAKITEGYKLPCKKIIHTVGPVYKAGDEKVKTLLKNAYINSLKLAEEYRKEAGLDFLSIAFPCISTGLYRFPKEEASNIAIESVREFDNDKIKVIFMCFDDKDYNIYIKNLYGLEFK